jgi:prepilin-type N-terminal cleavage/methylation domain-containing protein
MTRHTRRGFTLLELLMVITLLGLLAVFAFPDLHTASRSEHLRESAQRIRALVAMCRAEAMNEMTRYRIMVRPDGTLRVRCQADALKAPHLYITPRVDWARTVILLEDVFVEGLQLLPEGPPPIRIVNEKLQFPQTELVFTPVEELERPMLVDFDPDGTCNSLRLVLRDVRGHGLLLTLDGRVGRLLTEDWTPVLPEDVHRPALLEEEDEPKYKAEDFEW